MSYCSKYSCIHCPSFSGRIQLTRHLQAGYHHSQTNRDSDIKARAQNIFEYYIILVDITCIIWVCGGSLCGVLLELGTRDWSREEGLVAVCVCFILPSWGVQWQMEYQFSGKEKRIGMRHANAGIIADRANTPTA